VSEPPVTTGRCLCGDIEYAFTGAPDRVFHCHCDTCRRHVSSSVSTFVCVLRHAFQFTKGQPRVYTSSPGVRRSFCARCGSPIAYEADRIPDEVHLYHGTLSDPATVQPTAHVYIAEQVGWFEVQDDLPRYAAGMRGATPIRHGPYPVK
jgi:hypothetical protein